jgi:hypothetical protein
VRPHPQHAEQWRAADLGGLGPVVVWPAAGAAPSDDHRRAEYYDSIHHSAAVVGINPTAEIESAIIGRSVYSVLAPEFRETQEGTLHFSHLRDVDGGLLHLARTFPEHLEDLSAALQDAGVDDERCRRFVKAFVRPFGLGVPGTPRLVQALEALADSPASSPSAPPRWAPLVQPALARRGESLLRQACLAAELKGLRAAARARRKRSAAAAARTRADAATSSEVSS